MAGSPSLLWAGMTSRAPIRLSMASTYHGVPVTAVLQAYSICQIQPNPGFSDDNNYLKNTFAEESHLVLFRDLPETVYINTLRLWCKNSFNFYL